MTAPVAGTPAVLRSAPVSAPSTLAPVDLRALRDAIRGEVIVDGDATYDATRGIHNTHFSKKPGVIVRPADAIDVSRAVLTARELGLELAVKSGGHSVAGFGATDGGLLLDMRSLQRGRHRPDPLDRLRPGRRHGRRVHDGGAHVRHGHAVRRHLSVGLGGLTLGGGIGWLARKHGMTIDNLRRGRTS